MLVIEPDGEQYYKEMGIIICGDMPNVIVTEAKEKMEDEPTREPVPVSAAVHVEFRTQGKIYLLLIYSY